MKAVSSTQHHDTSTWKVSAAPGAQEVIWGNVRRVRSHAQPGHVMIIY